jgi:hypothetical protein
MIRRTFRRRPRNHYLRYENFTEAQMRHFCGMRMHQFENFYDTLQPRKNIFERYLDKTDQLVLTLMKYKGNYTYCSLGNLYDIDKQTAIRIFRFWTVKIYKHFKKSNPWDMRCQPKSYTAILNCVELKTGPCPNNPAMNRKLFSIFEFCNTFKYLVATDENGRVIYCSDIFGGSMSHNDVFKKSCVLNFLQPGDIVLSSWNDGLGQMLREKKIKLHTTSHERIYRSLISQQPPPNDEKIMEHRKMMLQKVKVVKRKHKILRNKVSIINWSILNKIVFVTNILTNIKCNVYHGQADGNV